MPTYEYKCDNCGHQFDAYQSMKDDKLTNCPVCGKETLKRLIGTGGGLIFKGSGFYLTDYKNKPSETPSTGTKETTSPKTETKGEPTSTKTETKSEPTSTSENSTKKADQNISPAKSEK